MNGANTFESRPGQSDGEIGLIFRTRNRMDQASRTDFCLRNKA